MSDTRQKVRDKLAEITAKAKELEAIENELLYFQDDEKPIDSVQMSLERISTDTDKKNLQTMIRASVVAEHEAKLSEIDESPESAFNHFAMGKLSDADKVAVRTLYKKGLKAEITKRKKEINSMTGLKL